MSVFSGVSSKVRYNEGLCQGNSSPSAFSQSLEFRVNKMRYGKWVEKNKLTQERNATTHEDIFYLQNSPGSENNDCNDYCYYDVRSNTIVNESEEVDCGPAQSINTQNYQVSVISHGSRRVACKTTEQRGSNYIYNPMPIRKKSRKKHVPPEAKDDAYWAQRIKNNIAARKSREERRRGEIEVVKKCDILLDENCKLRQENKFLEARLKIMESIIYAKLGGNN